MKKTSILLAILIISLNFASAGFFSDLFGLSGNAVYSNDNSGAESYKLLGKKVIEKINFDLPSTSSIPLDIGSIYGFSVDSKIKFNSESGLVRFILTDGTNEYLVYESYPQLHGQGLSATNNICEETCALDSFKPNALTIQIIDAEVTINSYQYIDTKRNMDKTVSSKDINEYNKNNKKKQDNSKIKALTNNKWIAAETSASLLTYSEKKTLTMTQDGFVSNLQGFEYYKGGVFEYPGLTEAPEPNTGITEAPSTTNLPSNWDWRNRHGENWHTSVKNQGSCTSCGAFAATGATEHLINLYYNQHLDMDLSESKGFFCYNAIGQTCSEGSYPSKILSGYALEGAVDEACFPYSTSTTPCENACLNPTERVVIGNRQSYFYSMGEETLKEMIASGAVSGGVNSMWHAMAMAGWETDAYGETIWIFKNSWGTGWGEAGYGNIKVPLSDIAWTVKLMPEITSTIGNYSIQCNDNDNDNYCSWGITDTKPSSCPSTCNAQKDCDDSNSTLGPFDESYNCMLLEGCADTDNGIFYEIYGEVSGIFNGVDQCLDEISLREYYCTNGTGTSIVYECPSLCKNGACVIASCSDSDGGKNYETSGTITGYMAFNDNPTDICLDEKTLQESYCFENLGYIESYICPGVCANGQCIEAIVPTITIINPEDNTSIIDKFLTITAIATETITVDFYLNSNFLNSDSSYPYTHKLNTKPYFGTNIIKAVATSISGAQIEDIVVFKLGEDEGVTPDPEPTTPECSDGKDNDRDKTCDYNGCQKNKAVFYPADPNCTGPEDTSESS